LVYREGLLQDDGGGDDDDDDLVSVPNFIHFDKGQIAKILCHENDNEQYEPANG
jgi:hypothetical protein